MMSVSWLKYLQLAYRSKPPADRVLYRAIAKHRPRSIVEMGLGLGQRSVSMIQLARRYQSATDLKYTGLDLFEARDQRFPGMTLKRAHRILGNLTEHVQLLPGDPCLSLAHKGNLLLNTDFVVVDLEHDPGLVERLWASLAKLLYQDSLVYVHQWQAASRTGQFVLFEKEQVHQMADETNQLRSRAA